MLHADNPQDWHTWLTGAAAGWRVMPIGPCLAAVMPL